MKIYSLLGAMLVCETLSMNVISAPADAFEYGVQSHGSLYQIDQYRVNRWDITGSITIVDAANYDSSEGSFVAENVFLEGDNGTEVCNGSPCNYIKGVTPKLVPPIADYDFSNPVENCVTDSSCTVLSEETFSSGSYGYIQSNSGSSIRLSASQQSDVSFYIQSLQVGEGGNLYLHPGSYWVDDLTVGANAKVIVDTSNGEGTARLFLKNSPNIAKAVSWNLQSNASSLFIFSQQNLSLSNSTINAFVYGEKTVTLDQSSSLSGSLSARHVLLKDNAQISENLTGLSEVQWGGVSSSNIGDVEQDERHPKICEGYSTMAELPSLPEDSNCVATKFPKAKLSETGCLNVIPADDGGMAFDPSAALTFAPGVVPYTVNSILWSDGAEKSRGFVIPKGSKITIHEDGDWEFPLGSVLIKNFDIYGKHVETRLMMRVDDGSVDENGKSIGGWYGFTYAWNNEQTEAHILSNGKTRYGWVRWLDGKFGSDKVWHYPSQTECFACHGGYIKQVRGVSPYLYQKGEIGVTDDNVGSLYGNWFELAMDLWSRFILREKYPSFAESQSGDIAKLATLGPETAQINLMCKDPYTGMEVNQFDVLKQTGIFVYSSKVETDEQKEELDQLRLADPLDPNESIDDRARSYLYVNCRVCHRGTLDGFGPGHANYHFSLSFDAMNLLEPNTFFIMDWSLGVKDNLLIYPGRPDKSIISLRMHFQNGGSYPLYGDFVRMPFTGTTKVDQHGVAVIDAWIKSGLGFSQFVDVDNDGFGECQLPGVPENCLMDDPDVPEGSTPVNLRKALGK